MRRSPWLLAFPPFALLSLAACTSLLGTFEVSVNVSVADAGATAEAGSAADAADATDATVPRDAEVDACVASGPCVTADCRVGALACVDGKDTCVATARAADDGAVCSTDGRKVCKSGACLVKCDATSCADGCCSDATTCVRSPSAIQCNVGGLACSRCDAPYVCPTGTCQCPTGTGECKGVGLGCVSVLEDDSPNCGACGHTCEPLHGCSHGVCGPNVVTSLPAGTPQAIVLTGALRDRAFIAFSAVAPSGFAGYIIVAAPLANPGSAAKQPPAGRVGTVLSLTWDGADGAYASMTSAIAECGVSHAVPSANVEDPIETTAVRPGACGPLTTDPSTRRVYYLAGQASPFAVNRLDPTGTGATDSVCFANLAAVTTFTSGGGAFAFQNGTTLSSGAGCGVTPSPLVTTPSAATAVANDGTRVFYADKAGIHVCPMNGGCAPSAAPLAAESVPVIKILSAGDSLYWIGEKGLVTCPMSGCSSPNVLVPGLPTTALFEVDARFVYWVAPKSSEENVLYRAPR